MTASLRGGLGGQSAETFRRLFRQLYDYGPPCSNLTLGAFMPRFLFAFVLVFCIASLRAHSQDPKPSASGHYLFAWTGDAAGKGNDFLAVIDADPASPSYGHLVTTVVTDQQTMSAHHTEYTMPAGGLLFANDHEA